MRDELLFLQRSTTKNASFTSDALVHGGGFRNLYAEIFYKDASATGTGNSVTFKVQHSPDGTTWSDLTTSDSVALASTAKAGQSILRVQTRFPNLRLVAQFTTGTGTPTITYEASLVLAEA